MSLAGLLCRIGTEFIIAEARFYLIELENDDGLKRCFLPLEVFLVVAKLFPVIIIYRTY